MKTNRQKEIVRIGLAIMLSGCLLLSGCSAVFESRTTDSSSPAAAESESKDSTVDKTFDLTDAVREESDAGETETTSAVKAEPDSEAVEESEASSQDSVEETAAVTVTLVVEPIMYLRDILDKVVALGLGEDTGSLLELTETISREGMKTYTDPETEEEAEQESHRAFAAEGYIAPGTYELNVEWSAEEVLRVLLSSWDDRLSEEIRREAKEQGFTIHEVLTMASIVEYESSKDPYNIVKPQVAAVVRNRIDLSMGLEMDVTIFYLEEALEPYEDPEEYENYYNTYRTEELPAGPINSPSLDSIDAILHPADTDDLYFVYDREGNYYFEETYEAHLVNVDLYLD